MMSEPPLPDSQYATEVNLCKRQQLWDFLEPPFDIVNWTLALAGISDGMRVLDVGCGNGKYQNGISALGARYFGVDSSLGMLRATQHKFVINADALALPFAPDSFDVVICPHVLYHIKEVTRALSQLRNVLHQNCVCVAVTNGAHHRASLVAVAEAVAQTFAPGWRWPSPEQRRFSLENGAEQMAQVFETVEVVRPSFARSAVITDPEIAAAYIASVADIFSSQLPWGSVVHGVRERVAEVISEKGSFTVESDVGAIIAH